MTSGDLKLAARDLLSDLGSTLLILLGLALAFALTFLLFAYVDAALNGDADIPAPRQVFRLEGEVSAPGAQAGWQVETPLPFYDNWQAMGAPVDAASRYFAPELAVRADDRLFRQTVAFVDPGFVRIFMLKAIAGRLEDALQRPDAVVLSEVTARKLFGTTDVLGRMLAIKGQPHQVAAVLPDGPRGSVVHRDVLVSIKSKAMPRPDALEAWLGLTGQNYVRLLPGADVTAMLAKAQAFFESTPAYRELPPSFNSGPKKLFTARFVALPDLALHGAGRDSVRRLTLGVSVACLTLIALAAVNYVSLSTVRAIARQREIGIRKSLGASPGAIARQFLAEAVLLALPACGVGLLVAWLAAPAIGEWLNQQLQHDILSLPRVALALLTAVLTGLVAGAYPALVAMRTPCSQVLAGRQGAETAGSVVLRRALVILQFGGSVALLATGLAVVWQTDYATRFEPGYDPAPLLAFDAPAPLSDPRLRALREALAQTPGVEAVGISKDVPGRGEYLTSTEVQAPSGALVPVAYEAVGPGFWRAYGIVATIGRVFDDHRDPQGTKDRIVINGLAARQIGFADPRLAVGQRVRFNGEQAEIIGVVADLRHRSIRDEPRPTLYAVDSERQAVVTVRAVRPGEIVRPVEQAFARYFPDDFITVQPVRQHVTRHYELDRHLGLLVSAASVLALALAGIGIYATSADSVRRRLREIALRRLFGASSRQVAGAVAIEFAMLVALGGFIGLVSASFALEQYLSGFANRAPVALPALATALGATGAVAVVFAWRHTASALRARAIAALRD